MKIVSYNVNGIRAAIRKGFTDWVASNDFDVIAIQETKAHPDQVDLNDLEALGYQACWHSATRRKGYSGVLTLSRRAPKKVVAGMGIETYDSEGRVLRTDFDDWTLLNCYFPSGTTGDERQTVKFNFLDDFYAFAQKLLKERPRLLVVGDYNIAHQEIDLHDPKRNQKTSGFLPQERAWMTNWFDTGFTDSFRFLHPDRVQYSWWSLRAASRERNKGWRLDYQSISNPLRVHLRAAEQLTEIKHSDHCPVLIDLEL